MHVFRMEKLRRASRQVRQDNLSNPYTVLYLDIPLNV
jgi:hypothetical protein